MKIEFKKLLSVLLLLSMLCSMMAFPAYAATPTWTGKFSTLDAAYKNGYVGEYYGLTTFTKSNGTESVAGVDYQASSSTPFGADGQFVMVHGDWGYYEVTAPYTGVYAFQIRTDWIGGDETATFHVTTDEGYLAQFNLYTTSWSSGSNADQPLYLKEGVNKIKIELLGSNNAILSGWDMGRLDAQGAEKSLDFLPLVKTVDTPVATPTPTVKPTATPTPTEAPLSWPGTFNDLSDAYKNGYVSTVGNIKDAIRNGANAVNGTDYQASSGSPWGANGSFTMVKGDWMYLDVDMPYTGVYDMQIRTDWSSGTPVNWYVTTEEGYAADYNITTMGWSSGCNQDQPIYLKEGRNTVKIELRGNYNATISCIDFGALNLGGAEKSLDYLEFVKFATSVTPTPTPTTAPTPTVKPTATPTPTVKPTATPTPTAKPTATPVPTSTPTQATTWIGNVKEEPAFGGYSGEVPATNFSGDYYAQSNHISGDNFTMSTGEWGTYTFNAPYTGVYGVQLEVASIGNPTTVRMIAGDYYADFNLTTTEWTNQDGVLEDQPMYFKAGANTFTLKNIGSNPVIISAIDYGFLNKSGYDSMSYISFVQPVSSMPAEPVATPVPTATPNITDSEYMIITEAESYTSATGVTKTTHSGTSVINATNESTSTYTVTVPDTGVYNLYLRGAAWKDVSVDITVDGTYLSYETMHFNVHKNESYPLQNEKIYSMNLTAGTHTVTFTYFTDVFYFDNFRLENTSSRTYHLLYGFKDATTSSEAYNILVEYGSLVGVDAVSDTSGIFYPEMSFWPMVGKDFDSLEDMLSTYNSIIASETTSPTVKLYNASNAPVTKLPTGTARLIINTSNMPANSTIVVAEYQGSKMVGNLNTLKSTSTTVTCTLTGLTAQSNVKIMVFSDLAEVKPYSSTGVYKDIYVATTGKSSNDGLSPETPLATVAQALTKVKSYNASMTGDIVVHIAPGIYRSNVTMEIDPTMSGMNGYKVILKAEDPTNRPILSGGEPLTGKWKKVSGENYWVASTSTRETRALYVNGYQATLARSDKWYLENGFIEPANPVNDLHIADGFYVDTEYWDKDFPTTLADDTRLQVVFQKNWANHRFPVEKVVYGTDSVGNSRAEIYIPYPRYHVFLHDETTTSTIQPTGSFYLENSMDLLDAPGEFYFDKDARKMYYYPYANEDMTTAETFCAVTDGLMTITGVSSQNKVTNMEFDGISFRYGAWDQATTNGAAFNQADELRIGDVIWYGSYMFPAQVTVNYAENVVFKNCEFADLGSSALLFEEGNTDCRVTGSVFHDISGTGVVVGSFQHDINMSVDKERSTHIEVDNNIFRRCAQEYLGTTAIAMYYTGDSRIHHNDIADMPYTAITVGWGWGAALPEDCGNNVVSYNKIEDVMQTMYDGSQIYTVGLQGYNQINDNYFIDPGDHLRGGLYLDQATKNLYFSDNVFTDAKPTTDRWLFARRYAQISDCYGSYNHTDGKVPSTSGSYAFDSSGVTLENNSVSVTSWSLSAQRIMAEAGVEDDSELMTVDFYPSWRTMRMLDVPADE